MLKEHEVIENIDAAIEEGYNEIDFNVDMMLCCSCEEYAERRLKNFMLMAEYPVIDEVMNYKGRITLSKKEHKALRKYLDNMFWMEQKEREEIYFRGYVDCITLINRPEIFGHDCDVECDDDMKIFSPATKSTNLRILITADDD
jgi:hypothetical protein